MFGIARGVHSIPTTPAIRSSIWADPWRVRRCDGTPRTAWHRVGARHSGIGTTGSPGPSRQPLDQMSASSWKWRARVVGDRLENPEPLVEGSSVPVHDRVRRTAAAPLLAAGIPGLATAEQLAAPVRGASPDATSKFFPELIPGSRARPRRAPCRPPTTAWTRWRDSTVEPRVTTTSR
jgi:hypothetical protein